MRRITAAIVLLGFAATSCGRSEARKREEIRNCSAITIDAPGISKCLEAQYRWKPADARVSGQARQHELDSLAVAQHDSLWHLDATRHRQELTKCAAAGGDVARCLAENFGWPQERATLAFDSLWQREGAKHRDAIRACERQRKSGVGACLILYYKWDPKHALALDDSIQRAKIRALNKR